MRGSNEHTPSIPGFVELKNGKHKKTCWMDVEGNLKIVDSTKGCTVDNDHFVLIPRSDSIGERMMGKDGSMQKELFEVFQKLEERSPASNTRQKNVQRVMMPDGENCKYVVIGTSPNRGGKGTRESMKALDCPDLNLHRTVFGKWYRRVEHCAMKYLPWYLRKLLSVVGDMCNRGTMPLDGGSSSDIWPALAVGRNVFLNVHTDVDYFWTLTSVVADEIPSDDDPIICYMCFPTLNLAVALRNGDLLLFNPLVPHCVSSRRNKEKEAYCLSLYMKSLLVGGSNNDQVVSTQNEEIADFVLDNCTNQEKTGTKDLLANLLNSEI